MDTLYDFFFGFEPNFRWVPLLTKLFIFMLLGFFICYILWFINSKVFYNKATFKKEHIIQLSMVWALAFFIFFFTTYCFFFFRFVGYENIAWQNWKIYIVLLPQLLTYFVALIVGFILINKYKKDLKPLNL
jgi:hypothetical protein